ncbi:MAG: CapA family protein [Anaerovoracaceae bacterium]|jgi:poly-gamma-glutamate synthesis protein (capsule biosynthesis protein)|nr:CapA family protein [Anaerovoracaceae bacterium]
MKFKKRFYVIIGILLLVSGYLFYSLFLHDAINPTSQESPSEEIISDLTTIEILCAGDVMYHSAQLVAASNGDGTYSFDETFKYIKPYVQEADLAICNLETTFSQSPYTGYPSFSTPDNLGETLKRIGFHVASTANNHVNDRGLFGIDRTLNVLHGQKLLTTGSRQNASQQRWATKLVKGVWMGTLAYTYQTPSFPGRVSINGSFVSDETALRLNTFGYEELDKEIVKINEQVALMKQAGIDIVVLSLHWGEEYQLSANIWQRSMQESLTKNKDIDVIFGSHPHTLQELEMADNRVPVFFSLGNFVSNQRSETLNNRYTETGAMGKVTLIYDRGLEEITQVRAQAIPTWVEKYSINGKDNYFIIPLDQNLENNPDLLNSGHLYRAQAAQVDAELLLTNMVVESVLVEEAVEEND